MQPFDWIEPAARRRFFFVLSILTAATMVSIAAMDRSLVTEQAPHGIVSFEFAGDAETSRDMLAAWSQSEQQRQTSLAFLIQGLDYLFLLLYPAWLAFAAQSLGTALGGNWLRWARPISWSVLLAAPFDAVENYALIEQLLHGASDSMARLAWWCAAPKFLLVIAAAVFVLVAFPIQVLSRVRA